MKKSDTAGYYKVGPLLKEKGRFDYKGSDPLKDDKKQKGAKKKPAAGKPKKQWRPGTVALREI